MFRNKKPKERRYNNVEFRAYNKKEHKQCGAVLNIAGEIHTFDKTETFGISFDTVEEVIALSDYLAEVLPYLKKEHGCVCGK